MVTWRRGGQWPTRFDVAVPVTVGVTSGCGDSTGALMWAAAEAARRGSPLRLVHVFAPLLCSSAAGLSLGAYLSPAQIAAERDAMAHKLRALADQALAAHRELDTVVDVLDGELGSTLAALSNAGESLVLGPGARRTSLVARWAGPGSVPLDRIRSPIVFAGRHYQRTRQITAVVHGSIDSDPVLAHALGFAREWRCGLHVISLASHGSRSSERQVAADEAGLFDQLTDLRTQHPGVGVTAQVAGSVSTVGAPAPTAGTLLVIGLRRGLAPGAIIQRCRLRMLVRSGSTAVCVVPARCELPRP